MECTLAVYIANGQYSILCLQHENQWKTATAVTPYFWICHPCHVSLLSLSFFFSYRNTKNADSTNFFFCRSTLLPFSHEDQIFPKQPTEDPGRCTNETGILREDGDCMLVIRMITFLSNDSRIRC